MSLSFIYKYLHIKRKTTKRNPIILVQQYAKKKPVV